MAGTTVNVAGTPVTLRPATDDDLDRVAEIAPGALAAVAARMITADTALVCDVDGCRDSAGPLDRNWFLDASTVPGLGESYRAWGVTSTLWIADIDAPEGLTVDVGFDGTTPTPFLPTPSIDVIDDEGGPVIVPGVTQAFGEDVYTVAAAFGQSFPPDAAWVGTDPVSQRAVDVDTQDVVAPAAGLFWSGLASAVPAAATLDISALTWLSSPTVGCGGLALCIPTIGKADVTVAGAETVVLCSKDRVLPLAVSDTTVTTTFDRPTSQLGAWGTPETTFDGRPVQAIAWTGTPPLVDGKVKLRVTNFAVMNGSSLVGLNGAVAQFGVDSEEALTRPLNAQVTRWFPGWTPC